MSLRISQKLEYAMRATIELALRQDSEALVPAREIAEAQDIPLRFLEQQLGALHKAGLVESFRGARKAGVDHVDFQLRAEDFRCGDRR